MSYRAYAWTQAMKPQPAEEIGPMSMPDSSARKDEIAKLHAQRWWLSMDSSPDPETPESLIEAFKQALTSYEEARTPPDCDESAARLHVPNPDKRPAMSDEQTALGVYFFGGGSPQTVYDVCAGCTRMLLSRVLALRDEAQRRVSQGVKAAQARVDHAQFTVVAELPNSYITIKQAYLDGRKSEPGPID